MNKDNKYTILMIFFMAASLVSTGWTFLYGFGLLIIGPLLCLCSKCEIGLMDFLPVIPMLLLIVFNIAMSIHFFRLKIK